VNDLLNLGVTPQRLFPREERQGKLLTPRVVWKKEKRRKQEKTKAARRGSADAVEKRCKVCRDVNKWKGMRREPRGRDREKKRDFA